MEKRERASLRQWHNSFNSSVALLPGEICNWKKHFRFVLREVIGYLESQAIKNKSRFVWDSVNSIVDGCNRYHKGKRYSKRDVEYALAFLVTMAIIERIPSMEWVNANGRRQLLTGFCVAPHDMCCTEIGGRCGFRSGFFVGPRRAPGTRTIRLPDWEENLANRRAVNEFYKGNNKT